jgi:DNA-binding NarL/FixJ family response regulator
MKVVISDDHVMFATLMQIWLQQTSTDDVPTVEIAAIASTGAETISAIRTHKPDILIQDIQLPDMSGITVITQMRKEFPAMRIFVLSGRADWARTAIEAGASGCMLKEDNPKVIQQILTWDTNAGIWISPVLGEKFYNANKELMKYHFTAVEQNILRLLHLPNADIAAKMKLSEGTVRNAISTIYQKTGIGTRTELTDWVQNMLLLAPLLGATADEVKK